MVDLLASSLQFIIPFSCCCPSVISLFNSYMQSWKSTQFVCFCSTNVFHLLNQVIHCTEEMTKQTLWDAMHTEQPNLEAVKVFTICKPNFLVQYLSSPVSYPWICIHHSSKDACPIHRLQTHCQGYAYFLVWLVRRWWCSSTPSQKLVIQKFYVKLWNDETD